MSPMSAQSLLKVTEKHYLLDSLMLKAQPRMDADNQEDTTKIKNGWYTGANSQIILDMHAYIPWT